MLTLIHCLIILKKRMENAERRQKERDDRASKRDAFIQETEEKKLAVANAMVQVLSEITRN